MDFEKVYEDVRAWAGAHGLRVELSSLPPGKAGEFDGLSARMNREYEREETVFYLIHALGSMVRWSLSRPGVQAMFDELRTAKKGDDRKRLKRAIDAYRAFEEESSEFAVSLLAELGYSDAVPSYTNFMRADLEALPCPWNPFQKRAVTPHLRPPAALPASRLRAEHVRAPGTVRHLPSGTAANRRGRWDRP